VTPYLSVTEASELIEFVEKAFGAKGTAHETPAGGIHAEMKIGDSMIMIGGGKAKQTPSMPTALHLYVSDADGVYQQALAAGATSLAPPADDPHLGDRLASVTDASGNQWYIATNKATGGAPEGLPDIMIYLNPDGAAGMIAFLKAAFAATEVFLAQSPEGFVHHAKMRIGSSVIEMGDPHGPYQPKPTMVYLYVDNVDAWYERALGGGATSTDEPADQPYGDRTATVSDPFGNLWYIATPIKGREGTT
jgi:PhnB protein